MVRIPAVTYRVAMGEAALTGVVLWGASFAVLRWGLPMAERPAAITATAMALVGILSSAAGIRVISAPGARDEAGKVYVVFGRRTGLKPMTNLRDANASLVGEAAPELIEAVSSLSHVTIVDSISTMRRAGLLAHIAAQRIAAGHVDDLVSIQPLYLQGP